MSLGAVRLSKACVQWGSAEAQRQPPCEVIGARHPPARRDRHGPDAPRGFVDGTPSTQSVALDCDPLRIRNASSEPRPRRWSPRRNRPWPSKNVLLSCRPGTEPPEPLLVARARGREDAPHRKCAREWTGRRPRFGAGLATRCRLLLVMLASPCRTSELLARARAASGRGAVPGRRRADVADVDTVDARCPRPRRRPPRLRGATGPRRAASRARLGCPSRLWRQLRGSRLRSSHGAASGQCQDPVGARQSVESCPLAAVHRE